MKEIYMKALSELASGLIARGVEFTFNPMLQFDGGQIRCLTWDAVCHNFSYGSESGLLELAGSLVTSSDGVEGYLTVEEVLKRLDNK